MIGDIFVREISATATVPSVSVTPLAPEISIAGQLVSVAYSDLLIEVNNSGTSAITDFQLEGKATESSNWETILSGAQWATLALPIVYKTGSANTLAAGSSVIVRLRLGPYYRLRFSAKTADGAGSGTPVTFYTAAWSSTSTSQYEADWSSTVDGWSAVADSNDVGHPAVDIMSSKLTAVAWHWTRSTLYLIRALALTDAHDDEILDFSGNITFSKPENISEARCFVKDANGVYFESSEAISASGGAFAVSLDLRNASIAWPLASVGIVVKRANSADQYETNDAEISSFAVSTRAMDLDGWGAKVAGSFGASHLAVDAGGTALRVVADEINKDIIVRVPVSLTAYPGDTVRMTGHITFTGDGYQSLLSINDGDGGYSSFAANSWITHNGDFDVYAVVVGSESQYDLTFIDLSVIDNRLSGFAGCVLDSFEATLIPADKYAETTLSVFGRMCR